MIGKEREELKAVLMRQHAKITKMGTPPKKKNHANQIPASPSLFKQHIPSTNPCKVATKPVSTMHIKAPITLADKKKKCSHQTITKSNEIKKWQPSRGGWDTVDFNKASKTLVMCQRHTLVCQEHFGGIVSWIWTFKVIGIHTGYMSLMILNTVLWQSKRNPFSKHFLYSISYALSSDYHLFNI